MRTKYFSRLGPRVVSVAAKRRGQHTDAVVIKRNSRTMYARSSTRAASQGLPRALRAGDLPPVWLCPRAHRGVVLLSQPRYSTRRLHTHAAAPEVAHGATRPPRPLQQPPQRLPTLSSPEQVPSSPKSLPLQCSGCGAFSQSTQPSQAGFFDLRRKATQRYLGDAAVEAPRERPGDRLVWEALQRLDLTRPEHAQLAALAALVPQAPEAKEQPDPGRSLRHHSLPLVVLTARLRNATSLRPLPRPGPPQPRVVHLPPEHRLDPRDPGGVPAQA